MTITSMMSHVVTPNQSAYAASKGALLQYTKLLAVEWARYNIRVNAVSPGYIHTDMTAGIMAQEAFRDAVLAQRHRAGSAQQRKSPRRSAFLRRQPLHLSLVCVYRSTAAFSQDIRTSAPRRRPGRL